MFVLITETNANELEEYKDTKLSLKSACEAVGKLEKYYATQGKTAYINFYIANGKEEKVYNGKFNLGSGYAQDLYEHIRKKLLSLSLDEQKSAERTSLLKSIESNLGRSTKDSTNEESKEKSNNRKHFLRAALISTGIFSLIGSILFVVFYSINHYSADESSEEVLLQALRYTSVQDYKSALKEFEKLDYDELAAEDQHNMLLSYLLTDNLQKAIDVDPSFADTAVNYLVATNELEKIKEIKSDSPVILFEISFLNKDYSTFLNHYEKVSLDERRRKMVVHAMISTGKLDQAMNFAKKVKDNSLQKQVQTEIDKKWK